MLCQIRRCRRPGSVSDIRIVTFGASCHFSEIVKVFAGKAENISLLPLKYTGIIQKTFFQK